MFTKGLGLFLLIICCLFSTEISFSQPDFNTWTGINIRYMEKKNFRFGLETQLRLKNNSTRFDSWYFTPEVQYKSNMDFKYAIAYRLSTSEFPLTSFGWSHRLQLEMESANVIKYLQKDSRLGQSFRIRGTSEWSEKLPDYYLRFRTKTSYNLPGTKLVPSVSAEIFYHFNDQMVYTFNSINSVHCVNKYRISTGLDIPLHKKHSFGINLIWQSKMDLSKSDFIIECNYQLDLTKKNKKE